MINEILEFNAYVTSPKSNHPRIQPKMLTGNFSGDGSLFGLEHILTVITRGFLFDDFSEEGIFLTDGTVNETLVETVKAILFGWLGFACAQECKADENILVKWYAKYPKAKDWLKEYYGKHCGKETFDENWCAVEEKWTGSLLEGDYRAKGFSINDVIADALELGELKKYYLVIRKDLKADVKPAKKAAVMRLRDRFSYLFYEDSQGKRNVPRENTLEKLLKNVAAYLYLCHNHPRNQRHVLLNRLQLLCWYGLDDPKNTKKNWFFSQCVYGKGGGEKMIMSADSNQGGNFIKMSIAAEFIETYEIALIDAANVKLVDKNLYWIMQDTGHGEASLECMN